MADNPIGITFMPGSDAQANGPAADANSAGSSDLASAFKILSLHLPNVLGASAIASPKLLTAPGAVGVDAGGASPYSAVFQALLKAMAGAPSLPSQAIGTGGGFVPSPIGMPPAGPVSPPLTAPAPKITIGGQPGGTIGGGDLPTAPPTAPIATPPGGSPGNRGPFSRNGWN